MGGAGEYGGENLISIAEPEFIVGTGHDLCLFDLPDSLLGMRDSNAKRAGETLRTLRFINIEVTHRNLSDSTPFFALLSLNLSVSPQRNTWRGITCLECR
jgi:hypothetical protein